MGACGRACGPAIDRSDPGGKPQLLSWRANDPPRLGLWLRQLRRLPIEAEGLVGIHAFAANFALTPPTSKSPADAFVRCQWISSLSHVLFGKPVSTFPGYALGTGGEFAVDRFKPCVASKNLGGLPESAKKRRAPVVAIAEPGLTRPPVGRVAALLHEIARTLDSQVLDRLGRRLAGLGVESPTELSRAEVCSLGEVGHRQALMQIVPRVGERGLDAIRFG